ncbi:MAG: LamG domain-containing protein [Planctomycetes bacterium]|nr:LamG domain-containing protein [Planctomycetota bacterium]
MAKKLSLAALLLTCAGAVPAAAQLPQILYYRFNEGSGTTTANFASPGQGSSNVPFVGTPTWQTPGQVGAAHVDFGTGSAGAANIASGWATDLSGDWTIECWIRPNASGTGLQYIYGDTTANNPSSFRVFLGGVAGTGIFLRTGWPDLNIVPPFSMNVAGLWTHVAVTQDATAGLLTGYINGVQIVQVASTGPNQLRGSNFRLGGYTGASQFNGAIDEFRVWNVARTPAEIAAYWNVELGTGFALYGAGCAGSGNIVPTLLPNGVPQRGTSFGLTAGNLNGGALAVPILGVSDLQWLGIALPLDLGLLGASGCNLWLSLEAVLPTMQANGSGPGTGSVALSFPIPNGPYQGAVAFAGFLIVDPVNSLGLINSPAARITIQ